MLKFTECSVYECMEAYEELKLDNARMLLIMQTFLENSSDSKFDIKQIDVATLWETMAKYYF